MKWRTEKHECGVIYEHNSYDSFAKEFKVFRENHSDYLENARKYYQERFSDEAFDRVLTQITEISDPGYERNTQAAGQRLNNKDHSCSRRDLE